MKLLAVDASQPLGGIATWLGDQKKQQILTDENATQLLQEIGGEHNYTHIYLGNGPGRMTGLRSAASFVSALACVYDSQVRVVSSMLIIATSAYLKYEHSTWQVIIDARLGQFYVAEYRFHQNRIEVITQPSLMNHYELSKYSCSIGSQNIPTAVTFESIPWLPALTLYKLWEEGGLAEKVEHHKIPLIYLREAC